MMLGHFRGVPEPERISHERWSTIRKARPFAPSPLVGEGWGGGRAMRHRGAKTRDPPPPPPPGGGGGGGGGAVPCGTVVPQRATPTPNPSPQGGGEEFAAR